MGLALYHADKSEMREWRYKRLQSAPYGPSHTLNAMQGHVGKHCKTLFYFEGGEGKRCMYRCARFPGSLVQNFAPCTAVSSDDDPC